LSSVKTQYSDEELMLAYQNGDELAFNILYQRYAGKMYGYLYKRCGSAAVAGDLLQEVFAKLHQSRDSYRSQFKFAPWIFMIVRNCLIDHFRKVGRSPIDFSSEKVDVVLQSRVEQAQENFSATESPDLSQLSDAHRQLLNMRYSEDLSFEQIAKRLKTSDANARQLISRALKNARKVFASKPKGKSHES